MKRALELVVDQPIPGHFYWTLLKLDDIGQPPAPVDYARGPLPTHVSAMEQGIKALQRHHDARRAQRAIDGICFSTGGPGTPARTLQ